MPNGFDRIAAILLSALECPEPAAEQPQVKPKRARRPAKKRAKGAK
jgi:hypothetical protein